MKQIKRDLASAFDIIDINSLVFYVCLKITYNQKKKTIKLSQPSYIKKLLNQHGILKAKIAKIPMQKTSLLLYDKLVSPNKKTKSTAKIKSIIYTIIEI